MKKIYMHKRKTWKKKEKREKKGKLHKTAKAHRGRGLITTIESLTEYTPIIKIKTVQQK